MMRRRIQASPELVAMVRRDAVGAPRAGRGTGQRCRCGYRVGQLGCATRGRCRETEPAARPAQSHYLPLRSASAAPSHGLGRVIFITAGRTHRGASSGRLCARTQRCRRFAPCTPPRAASVRRLSCATGHGSRLPPKPSCASAQVDARFFSVARR
jgi:hypothetical protein